VLLEKRGRREGQLGGRSPYLQPVHLDGPDHLVGQIVPVKIVTGHKGSLTGELAEVLEPA
jgi:tRNA-2-methylthio-N6-dimethylallyladenosine synthase